MLLLLKVNKYCIHARSENSLMLVTDNREFDAFKKKSKDYYIISHTPEVAMSGLPKNLYGLYGLMNCHKN